MTPAILLASAAGVGLALAASDCPSSPSDVERFVAERELCDHFRGELLYSEGRRAFIERAMERHCRGMDAWLASLKNRYQNCPAVIERLNTYEPDIEPRQ